MNPVFNNLRKSLYFVFDRIVGALGGYEHFHRVFEIAEFTGALRNNLGYVGGSSKKEYLHAIARSFPEKSPGDCNRILKDFWKEHQRIFLELFMYSEMKQDNIEHLVDFKGLHHLDRALARGGGAILPVPHFGNVRLLHYALALKGYPLAVVSSEYSDDPEIVRRFKLEETSQVQKVGFRGQNPKWIMAALKDNHLLQIASTAEAGAAGVEVDFLQRKLFLSSGWVRFALTTGALILPTYILRNPDNRQMVEILPELPLNEGKNRSETIRLTAASLLCLYEPIYRRNPHLIDWMSWMVRLKEAREHFGNGV